MGVVHKLKDEVVGFIVQQKKDDPSLSCRKLSDIVSERYQLKVSKSSINTILKSHSLSASVGRPASKTPKKAKFSIPKEKKDQLFGKGTVIEEPKPEKPLDKTVAKESLRLMPDPIKLKEDKKVEKIEVISQNFDKKIEEQREEENKKKGPLLDHAGVIFLKVALAQMGLSKMMAELLSQHIQSDLHPKIELICEATALLRFLGIEDETQMHSEQMDIVWTLTDEDIKEATGQFWQNLSSLKMPKNFDVIFLNELQQQSAEVSFFKFLLEDGTHFLTDAHLSSFEPKDAASSSWPIAKALSVLSEQIVSNNDDTIIESLFESQSLKSVFFDFVKAYENNAGKALVKVEVLDANKQKLAEFTTIPKKRRRFIAGLSPENDIFREVTKSIKWAGLKPYYEPKIDQACFYAEISTSYFDNHIGSKEAIDRVVTVWKENRDEPALALISNDSSKSAESIVGDYLMRWSKALKEENGFKNNSKNQTGEVDNTKNVLILSDLFACFDHINEQALKYCAQHYFNQTVSSTILSHLKSGIYDISGHIIRSNESLKAILTAPKEASSAKLLSIATNNINQGYIFDNNKLRVLSILDK